MKLYEVKEDDTIESIAEYCSISVNVLLYANPDLKHRYYNNIKLTVGQCLNIPDMYIKPVKIDYQDYLAWTESAYIEKEIPKKTIMDRLKDFKHKMMTKLFKEWYQND